VRLPVRGSTPPDAGDRRDLSNTFRQLPYPNLTPSRFHLLLSRIGERDGDRNNGAMMQKQPAQFHVKGVGGGRTPILCRRMARAPKPGVARDSRLMPVPIATADT
jgi:hypothetical protein